jgi:hypothetical protein
MNMRKSMRTLLLLVLLMAAATFTLAQNPPHPNNGGGPGAGNAPVGGGAPLDGGTGIFLLLGAAYGSRKIHRMKK